MKKTAIIILVLSLVALGSGFYLWKSGRIPGITTGEADHTHDAYYCPMHPQQRSDKAGNCPICSMKLVPLEGAPGSTTATGASSMPGMPGMPGMAPTDSATTTTQSTSNANQIFIAPERQQLIGVKSVAAEVRPLVREIRTVGRVAYDETKITHIHTKVAGFIEDVFVDYVGRPVKRGEALFTIYSPELVATQEEYLLAVKSSSVLKDSQFPWVSNGGKNLLEAARRRLLLWDVAPEEVEALEKSGTVKRALTIHSPVSGVVTERQAYHHGRYVTPDLDLYTIVDLSTVWALGQVYEYDLPFLKIGQTVQVEMPYSLSQTRRGRIVFVAPSLDPKTRTVELRVEFANPDLTLRPEMFVNYRLSVDLGRKLVVPVDAVLNTGNQQYVFVDKGNGYFEPRFIKVGPQTEEHYAVEEGLQSGERVVTAANFILDSEARLKTAFASMGEPTRVPVGGPGAGAQNLQVEVLEPRTAKTGSNNIRLLLKDASGKPIEDAEVEVGLFMPQMGNMPPMSSNAVMKHEGGGIYAGTIQFLMAWTWETTVTAKKNGQVIGSAKTTITAR